MRDHALRAVESADIVVLVREASDARPPLPLPREPDLTVCSKADLAEPDFNAPCGSLPISAISGFNMDRLRKSLDRLSFGADAAGASLALNTRHVQAIGIAGAVLRERRSKPARRAGLSCLHWSSARRWTRWEAFSGTSLPMICWAGSSRHSASGSDPDRRISITSAGQKIRRGRMVKPNPRFTTSHVPPTRWMPVQSRRGNVSWREMGIPPGRQIWPPCVWPESTTSGCKGTRNLSRLSG